MSNAALLRPSKLRPASSMAAKLLVQLLRKDASMASAALEKGIPANIDAEKFILGSILLDDSVFIEIAGALQAGDFCLEKHQRIFRRMLELHERNEKVDRITLANELLRFNELESVDGLRYLVSLDDGLPKLPNLDGYIKIIRDKASLRQMIAAAQQIMNRALLGEDTPEMILAGAEETLLKLGESRVTSGLLSPREVITNYEGGINAFLDPSKRKKGINTGFTKLDEMTGGLHRGDLIILAARPSMGKTALALKMCAGGTVMSPRIILCCIALSVISAVALEADSIAYSGSDTGAFGTFDLNTGVFTSLGNSGQTLSGMAVAAGTLFAASYHTANGTLFSVNPANGALTSIGSASGVDIDDFGSTTTGLYAVSFSGTQDLYSINPSTGAATLIGPTGLGYGSWRGLSTNSANLYFGDGANLYTLNTATGASTLVGAFGGSAEMGALLTEGGILYGGDDVNNTIDTINVSTGAATVGPSSGLSGSFYGLAPNPIPTSTTTPEPGTWGMLAGGFAVMVLLRQRLA
jgi:hypothetical protein